jgi:EAL and modified HD-GYP domain-containing signal transduction protein
LLYAKPGKAGQFTSPLLQMATTRGKLLELMAQKLRPRQRNIADIAFTVGIMSLMDALFGMPMNEILTKVVVVEEVSSALIARHGLYGEMLKLAEYIEHLEEADALLVPTLKKLQLSVEDLYELQLAAFEWTDKIAQSTS